MVSGVDRTSRAVWHSELTEFKGCARTIEGLGGTILRSLFLVIVGCLIWGSASADPVQMLPPTTFDATNTVCNGATGGLLYWDGTHPIRCVPGSSGDASGNVAASGTVQVGTTKPECTTAIAGAIRYDQPAKELQYCNGDAWVSAFGSVGLYQTSCSGAWATGDSFICETINTQTAATCGFNTGGCVPGSNGNTAHPTGTYQIDCGMNPPYAGSMLCGVINTQTGAGCIGGTACIP